MAGIYKKPKNELAHPKSPKDLKIGIVVSLWNDEITDVLKKDCQKTLIEAGITSENLVHANVPGAFELPFGARTLLSSMKLDAVICLGCVIRGATPHDDYINTAVANGIIQLSLASGKPVIYGVLTVLNEAQAVERASGPIGRKGVEAANAALAMIGLKETFLEPSTKIGF